MSKQITIRGPDHITRIFNADTGKVEVAFEEDFPKGSPPPIKTETPPNLSALCITAVFTVICLAAFAVGAIIGLGHNLF